MKKLFLGFLLIMSTISNGQEKFTTKYVNGSEMLNEITIDSTTIKIELIDVKALKALNKYSPDYPKSTTYNIKETSNIIEGLINVRNFEILDKRTHSGRIIVTQIKEKYSGVKIDLIDNFTNELTTFFYSNL